MRKSSKTTVGGAASVPKSFRALQHCLSMDRDPAISYADQYPGVPRPEPALSPLILAAQWSCRDLHAEDLPAVAAELLQSGHDTPSVPSLARETAGSSSAGFETLVGSMFQELSVPYPITMKQAKLIVTRQLAREVIHGKVNAWVAASCHLFKQLSWRRQLPGLWVIYFLNEEFESIDGRPTTTLAAELLDTFARLALLKSQDYLREVA
jgi:hypothetical protein